MHKNSSCLPVRGGAWLLVVLSALAASPAWGGSFTGQLVFAEGARTISDSAGGQVEHFEAFTFIEDASGIEYDLVEYEGKLPHRSVRGTLVGDKFDAYTIAVDFFVEAQAAQVAGAQQLSQATIALPLNRSLLTVKVNMQGTWLDGTEFTLADNPVTEERLRFMFWEREWHLQQFFDAVTRSQYTFDNDLDGDEVPDFAEVSLDFSDVGDPCVNGLSAETAPTCTQIRNAANCALAGAPNDPVFYFHRVYVGPSGWSCGSGLGTVGSSQSQNVYVMMVGDNTNTLIHEVGHNVGLLHSGQELLAGGVDEYGDRSDPMGITAPDVYTRKGFNAVQLSRLGLMEDGRTRVVPSPSDNASGLLHATYYPETGGLVTRLVKLGDSTYFLTYRSPVDPGVDQMANHYIGTLEGVVPNYTGRLLVHVLQPETLGNGIDINQVTLVGSLAPGESGTFGGYAVNVAWATDDMLYFRIGPSPPSAPSPPNPVVSSGTIVARAESTDWADARTSTQSATQEQRLSGLAYDSSYGLDLTAPGDGELQDLYARLRLNLAPGTPIGTASLKLQVAAQVNGLPEFQGGTGSITVEIEAEDADSSAPMAPGSDLRTRTFTHTKSSTFFVPVRQSDEISLDVTELVQAMVDRPGWVGGNYILLKLRRTAGTGTVSFSSARYHLIRKWFSSPRVVIDVYEPPTADLIMQSGFES